MSHFWDVSDLTAKVREPVAFSDAGDAHARRQVGVRPVDGSSSLEDLRSYRRAVRWRSSRPRVQLRQSVSLHGVRATHLSREFARHRNLPARAVGQALSPGHPRSRGPQHVGRCERSTRLAYLCRVCPTSDPDRAPTLPRGTLRRGPVDLKETVYALDSTTIDLCLALFPWAPFRSTKAAIKLHTLIDLRGNIPTRPDESWMLQIARNVADAQAGALRAKRYLIIDRDAKYSEQFRRLIRDSGTNVIRLPPMSPNLNAHAERFVRSIKDECLNRMIGQASLRRAVAEYVEHYHSERNHQGLENQLIHRPTAVTSTSGAVRRHARLDGTLNFYYRDAA
jgi:transposase InsO family protein